MPNVILRNICAFLILVLWASGASASSLHQHEKMSSTQASVSPFQKHAEMSPTLKSEKGHLVCLLKNHQKGLPCPHSKNHKKHKGFVIESDCNGKHAGSIPTSLDFSKNLFFAFKVTSLTLDNNPGMFFPLSPGYRFYLPLQIDHPPKFL